MNHARPLREVFDELAGEPSAAGPAADPAGVLAGSGHGDLPGHLVAEAIVSYADTAPVEVAAHLAPFVTAHSAVPRDGSGLAEPPDLAAGLDLLATAPAVPPGESEPLPGDESLPFAGATTPVPEDGSGPALAAGDDFGAGDVSGPEVPIDALAGVGGPDPAAEDALAGAGTDPFGLDFEAAADLPGEPEPGGTGGFGAPPASGPDEPEPGPDGGLAG
jgi:hypothetical protein